MNLDTGVYYSLVGVGADIWSSLERGGSVSETVERALGRYDAPRPVVEHAVSRFVDELAREELIVAAGSDEAGRVQPVTAENGNRAASEAFAEPVLNKYTDMQELLLLDPIHEVDEEGWPVRAAPGAELDDNAR